MDHSGLQQLRWEVSPANAPRRATPSQSVYEGKCKTRHGRPLLCICICLNFALPILVPHAETGGNDRKFLFCPLAEGMQSFHLRFPNAWCQLCVVALSLCQAYKVVPIYIKPPNGLICVGFHHQRVPEFRVFRRKSAKCLSFYLSAIYKVMEIIFICRHLRVFRSSGKQGPDTESVSVVNVCVVECQVTTGTQTIL